MGLLHDKPSWRNPFYSVQEEIANSVTHGIGAGLAIAGLAVLVVLAVRYGDPWQIVSVSIFGASLVLLYSASTLYHAVQQPRLKSVLRKLDHASIYLLIAGTYTPFALLLPPDQARTLLLIVWTGAVVGVLFRVLWAGAPRWLYVPVYVLLGWVAVFYFGPLLEHAGGAVMVWVVLGGVLYSLGAVVYGTKRPDISPRWFGFHEVFHALTVLAFGAHFVAASIALSAGTTA